MKTAMQELIEWMEEDLENGKKTIGNILEKSNDLLEKEKEQIIDSYEDGKQNGIESITNVNKYIIGEYYYNQTYKPETI